MKMIYGLSAISGGPIVYVGMSKNDLVYVSSHIRTSARSKERSGAMQSPLNAWVISVGYFGFKAEVLEMVSEEDAQDRLVWWQDYVSGHSGGLLNVSRQEQSERLREALKRPEVVAKREANRPRTYRKSADWESKAGKTGRHLSEAHKAAISAYHTGKVLSPETKALIAQRATGHSRNLGRRHSPETRAKMSLVRHEKGHAANEIVREGCAWCAGQTFEEALAKLR